ncbi:hypothetical protein Lfu02_28760 [Longispora fulva]|uniref:Uncharacterized protein n=1 Tax=Longispora fulva TaxID=619741 RepID=A0A8J7KMD1_9ACTN|nr:hypothetical protein [Longispora fulva]MBG6139011.1 hypothetical protein [Longispora fulva]GIG58504.1 hypothetical protein Lfu02_28760 [Longispora fulva]
MSILPEFEHRVTARLTELGAADPEDPALRAVGGKLVFAETELRILLGKLPGADAHAAHLDALAERHALDMAGLIRQRVDALVAVRKVMTFPPRPAQDVA